MKTSPVTPADLISSIIALPPLARAPDGTLDRAENLRATQWLAGAQVSAFMYGGVANMFNASIAEYAPILDLIESLAPPDAWVVPAIGADFGKAREQIEILRGRAFPTAILLPFAPVQSQGVATGLRRLSDRFGRPLMVFYKTTDYLTAADAAALLADGVLCCVEYGVAPDPSGEFPYLVELLDLVGDAGRVIDGAGEKSIVATSRFGLRGYTSGSGLIAPHLSMALLAAVRRRDAARAAELAAEFAPFEDLRARFSPIPVVHAAVQLAGIADAGALGPFFAPSPEPAALEEIAAAALDLKARSLAFATASAT